MNAQAETSVEQVFSVSDLALAAFLCVRGVELLRVEGADRHATFVFAETPDLHPLIRSYFRDGQVTAHEYAAQGTRLKRLIFVALRDRVARP